MAASMHSFFTFVAFLICLCKILRHSFWKAHRLYLHLPAVEQLFLGYELIIAPI